MDPKIKIVIAVVAIVVVVLVIAWAIVQKRRSEMLRRRFGPEYERTVREHGPARGETVLLQREKRVEKFPIRELSASERERFVTEWREVQLRFVDEPRSAVTDADLLVVSLMQSRGYPTSDFEQRTADISVTHPVVVDNYRAAREIVLRDKKGEATTEDMRNAIRYYRSLFDELLQTKADGSTREVA
jgi:hypothetical protein